METTKLYCFECGSVNRIPSNRLLDGPKCGSCKESLFAIPVFDLSQSNAAKALQNTEIPVLVDCWASWCGPCRSFAPTFTKVAADYRAKVRFTKLNTEQEQQLAQQWHIRSIPTLILFESAKEVARVAGALPESQFKAWLDDHL